MAWGAKGVDNGQGALRFAEQGWQIDRVAFEGFVPQQGGEDVTAWEFTAHAGNRRYTVWLLVQNRLLKRLAQLPVGEPPPAELVPRLQAYVRARLSHPIMAQRHPSSLQGVGLHLGQKAEWVDMLETQPG